MLPYVFATLILKLAHRPDLLFKKDPSISLGGVLQIEAKTFSCTSAVYAGRVRLSHKRVGGMEYDNNKTVCSSSEIPFSVWQQLRANKVCSVTI